MYFSYLVIVSFQPQTDFREVLTQRLTTFTGRITQKCVGEFQPPNPPLDTALLTSALDPAVGHDAVDESVDIGQLVARLLRDSVLAGAEAAKVCARLRNFVGEQLDRI